VIALVVILLCTLWLGWNLGWLAGHHACGRRGHQ
jgi:hypothetical protein